MNKALAERNPVKALLAQDAMKNRFREVLGERAPQFMASIANVALQLPGVEPMSIIGAANVAALVDLPIDKNLGFAHIVPYSSDGKRVAQFQMGYKGFIQLALRTGQYESMNAKPINDAAWGGWDEIGEPIIHWNKIDESKPAVGYAFAWKLITGFKKTIYWSKEKIDAHAKRYSAAVKSGKKDTPWLTHYDQMALKTVVKDALSHWGILSVQLQRAIVHDQSVTHDFDGEIEYVDGTTDDFPKKKPEGARLKQFLDDKKAERAKESEQQEGPEPEPAGA